MRPDNPTVGLPVVSPTNMLPVQVIQRTDVAPGVVSVFIVLPGSTQAPAPYLPGQFVTLALPTPRETLYRSYSLCGDGDAGEPWELTIKRMEMGAVSTYFYQHVVEGTLLYASLPRGIFTLPKHPSQQMVLLFCAVGSGVTPIMGMLRAIARMPRTERPYVQLHYASRSVEDIIFRRELEEMDPAGDWLRQWHYLSSEGNRMQADALVARAGTFAAHAHWYVCGPDALKHELQARLQAYGLPAERFHAEVFATGHGGPAYRVAESEAEADEGKLRIADTGAELDVQPSETLLMALERHGYRPSFSCRAGACGQCRLKVLTGEVSPVGESLTPSERAAGYVLSCVARPMGEVTLASGGRPPAGVARVAGAPPLPSSTRRPGVVVALRTASLVGMTMVTLGAWQLTNHRPATWDTATTSQIVTPTATTVTSPDSHAPKPPAPTVGVSSGPAPAPPPAAKPTPVPKPVPTATATPSPAH